MEITTEVGPTGEGGAERTFTFLFTDLETSTRLL